MNNPAETNVPDRIMAPDNLVDKWYQPELKSFLFKRSYDEVERLPQNEQHVLVVLELEKRFGVDYARDISDKLTYLHDIGERITIRNRLNNDFESEGAPDAASGLMRLVINTYRLTFGDLDKINIIDRDEERVKRVINNFIAFEALETLKSIPENGLYAHDESDIDFLKEQEGIFLNNFFDVVSKSGFTRDELMKLYKSGQIVTHEYGKNGSIIETYLLVKDADTDTRAFLGTDGMFTTVPDHGFEIIYCPDRVFSHDKHYTRPFNRPVDDITDQEKEILDLIRTTFNRE